MIDFVTARRQLWAMIVFGSLLAIFDKKNLSNLFNLWENKFSPSSPKITKNILKNEKICEIITKYKKIF